MVHKYFPIKQSSDFCNIVMGSVDDDESVLLSFGRNLALKLCYFGFKQIKA